MRVSDTQSLFHLATADRNTVCACVCVCVCVCVLYVHTCAHMCVSVMPHDVEVVV